MYYWEANKPLTTEQENEMGLEVLLDEFESEYGIDRTEALDLVEGAGGYDRNRSPEDYF